MATYDKVDNSRQSGAQYKCSIGTSYLKKQQVEEFCDSKLMDVNF